MKTHIFFSIVFVILIVGFSACERVSQIIQPFTPQKEEGNDKISVGVVLPLTGHLAATGKRMKQGFDLARDAHPNLTFIFEDSIGTPEGAVEAFNKLILENGVSVILGPATSSATQAAFPIAQENQVVAISPTSGARGLSAIGDFVFRVPLTTDVVVPRGVELTQAKLNYQRVATMYDETDFFSTDRDAALQEAFTAKGIEVLTTEVFHSGDTDFLAQLTRIKALDPDAIFVSALPPEKPDILIQADQLGITAHFIISSLTPVEAEAAGPAAEGAITFTGWLRTDETPGNQAFVENYTTTFGITPEGFAAASYASVSILAVALQNAESIDAMSIRDALVNLKDFETILGSFAFNADGDAVYDPNVMVVRDGRLQRIEPSLLQTD